MNKKKSSSYPFPAYLFLLTSNPGQLNPLSCRDGPSLAKVEAAVRFSRRAQLFHPWHPPIETIQVLNINFKASVKSVS